MSKKGTPVLYANSGSLVVSAQDVLLKLRLTTGDTHTPVALVALPLTFATRLAAQLTTALHELTGESRPHEPGIPFEPHVLPSADVCDTTYPTARHPRTVVSQHASTIRTWRAAGLSAVEIARRLQVSRSTIHRFLQEGPSTSPGRGSSLDGHGETIWQQRRQGQTYQEIATALGTGRTTVWAWCQAHPDPEHPDPESNIRHLAHYRRPQGDPA